MLDGGVAALGQNQRLIDDHLVRVGIESDFDGEKGVSWVKNFGRLWRYYRENQSVLDILLAKSIILVKCFVLRMSQKLKFPNFAPFHLVIVRKPAFL